MKIQEILEQEIETIKPSEKETLKLRQKIDRIIDGLSKKLKGKATIMLGGSFSKDTVIRKEKYDADIFVRFFKNPDSDALERILKKMKLKAERLHGSRDYFRVKMDNIFIEIVPILNLKANKTEKAENVTDVSPFHVDYIKKKVSKNPKLSDEIRLAKAFCYALGCYGAESHIRGFSGYCLEVLVSYYGSFTNLLKASAKWQDKTVIDPEKHYKSKEEILRELNESKLISPLVIVDPVQKNRNVSAALSEEKFMLFKEKARKFLAHPSKMLFEPMDIENEMKDKARKVKKELLIVSAESEKKKEDIAGAKLLKFLNVIKKNLENEGYTTESEIKFHGNKAEFYFLLGKKDLIVEGPFLDMPKHLIAFKKKWKKTTVKGKRIIAIKKASKISWKKALKFDNKILKEMSVKKVKAKQV
jgi:tRNA nucleotidyltransferase (CCA-adding enzyme)